MNQKQMDFSKKYHWKLNQRVLCQARGLSTNHNAMTAFIDIPPNSPHGLLLVCSHPECARSQRRFRYCRGMTLQNCRQSIVGNRLRSDLIQERILTISLFDYTVCNIPVAKQNFRQRHGHGLIETFMTKIENSCKNDDIEEMNFGLYNLPQIDERELNCFFEWFQSDGNIFE